MPVMDGLTATRALRSWEAAQKLPSTPVIALTGFGAQEEVQAIQDAGCTSHLSKPIKRQTLLNMIRAFALQQRAIVDATCVSHGAKKITVQVDRELQDLVPGYLQNRREDARTLQRSLSEKDFETMRILGHSMKGSGGGYGFDGITEIGEKIEAGAKNCDEEELRLWTAELVHYLDGIEVIYG